MNITFSSNPNEALSTIDKLINGLGDFRQVLKEVEVYQKEVIEKQFASEGKETSSGWTPLASATINARLSAGYSAGPILTASGKLRASFETFKLNRDTLVIGSRVSYFKYHQLGTEKMPQRVVLNITQKMAEEIGNKIKNYLITKARHG